MKKLYIMISLLFMVQVALQAGENMKCGAGKCGSSMKSPTSSMALSKMHEVDGYDVALSSKKSLVVGNNDIQIALFKKGKEIDAKVKLKFFMPAMPGMPHMETKKRGITKKGKLVFPINFSMGGTWQYQLKFKTKDKEVHKLKGAINL